MKVPIYVIPSKFGCMRKNVKNFQLIGIKTNQARDLVRFNLSIWWFIKLIQLLFLAIVPPFLALIRKSSTVFSLPKIQTILTCSFLMCGLYFSSHYTFLLFHTVHGPSFPGILTKMAFQFSLHYWFTYVCMCVCASVCVYLCDIR